jgi:hypothetical protein
VSGLYWQKLSHFSGSKYTSCTPCTQSKQLCLFPGPLTIIYLFL